MKSTSLSYGQGTPPFGTRTGGSAISLGEYIPSSVVDSFVCDCRRSVGMAMCDTKSSLVGTGSDLGGSSVALTSVEGLRPRGMREPRPNLLRRDEFLPPREFEGEMLIGVRGRGVAEAAEPEFEEVAKSRTRGMGGASDEDGGASSMV
jgi:hypothetical protein